MKLGFVGLGKMGAGMARNLQRAGHTLSLYNRTREKAEALAAEFGAKEITLGIEELDRGEGAPLDMDDIVRRARRQVERVKGKAQRSRK